MSYLDLLKSSIFCVYVCEETLKPVIRVFPKRIRIFFAGRGSCSLQLSLYITFDNDNGCVCVSALNIINYSNQMLQKGA